MKPHFNVRTSYDVFKTKTRRKLVDEIGPRFQVSPICKCVASSSLKSALHKQPSMTACFLYSQRPSIRSNDRLTKILIQRISPMRTFRSHRVSAHEHAHRLVVENRIAKNMPQSINTGCSKGCFLTRLGSQRSRILFAFLGGR